MDVFPQKPPEPGSADSGAPDPRLAPTPDYGTMGPDSDFAKLNGVSSSAASPTGAASPGSSAQNKGNLRTLQLIAALGGMVSALLVAGAGRVGGWQKVADLFSPRKKLSSSAAGFADRSLERQRPQKQAEILLARGNRTDPSACGRMAGKNSVERAVERPDHGSFELERQQRAGFGDRSAVSRIRAGAERGER